MGTLSIIVQLEDTIEAQSMRGSILDNATQLCIEDESSPDGFRAYELASLVFDDNDPGILTMEMPCSLPRELLNIPRWLRGIVRNLWQRGAKVANTEWEFPSASITKENASAILKWLFNGRY